MQVERHQDLGQLSGQVLLFGGAYSNAQALAAMREWAKGRGIAPSNVIFTGDAVAYCAAPIAVLDGLRDWGVAHLAGNVERQLATHALDCGCGFDAGTTCDRLSAAWYGFANAAIDAPRRKTLENCPDVITFQHAGKRVAVIHGGASDVARFLWPVTPTPVFAAEIDLLTARFGPLDMVVAGHCGMAFEKQIDGVTWLNAGVIGMPPNNGQPQTEFATLSAKGQPQLHCLAYDHASARAAMEQAGLTQGYHVALTTGLWPSEDVLPQEMRRA